MINLINGCFVIPIGKDINVLTIGKFLDIKALNIPYLLNQESDFNISSSFIKKYLPYFFINGLPPKYPIKYITMAQNTLPRRPIKKEPKNVNIPRDANIPPVASINSLGITIITASKTIPKNIPKYPKLPIKSSTKLDI